MRSIPTVSHPKQSIMGSIIEYKLPCSGTPRRTLARLLFGNECTHVWPTERQHLWSDQSCLPSAKVHQESQVSN